MERPPIKDKAVLAYVEALETELEKFKRSPYKDSYVSLLYQIECWNSQLSQQPIDLFADKESKEFDRAHKYFTEQKPYFEQLEYLRKLMTPEESKAAERAIKDSNIGLAEQMALKERNG